ncbi:MAG: tyrosine-type recombinase/integrase [Planctomycetia bacterium]
MTDELILSEPSTAVVTAILPISAGVPRIVVDAGPAAGFVWEEFFSGQLRNRNTRTAYLRAVHRFFRWIEPKGILLPQITPGIVGDYLDSHPGSAPTKKQHLAALRRLFDLLVVRHVVVLNPAASVRTERYEVVEGKTPDIAVDTARLLLKSIDATNVVGLRDRAVLATLVYTAARVGAVAKLRMGHLMHDGTQYLFRFDEKGGKSREIPARHDLEVYLSEYRDAAGIAGDPKESPLFRSAERRTKRLTAAAMSATDIARMLKRRLRDAGLSNRISPHSFRVTTITNLLEQGVALEDVQYLAGHSDPRTTRLYDRRHRKVTRNIVERIDI